MPFVPLRLCIVYDNARGHCGRVVPRMKTMLEQRAFLVDTHEIGQGSLDIAPYRGLIFGTPVTGLGIRGEGPSRALRAFIEALPDLDEHQVAIFCVYETRPGNTFDRMKNLLFEKGARFVAEQAFWAPRPLENDHIIPAECMVRIR
ncbi:MAG: flavodoxin domain-containing protein [Pseudomonadota bacterium]